MIKQKLYLVHNRLRRCSDSVQGGICCVYKTNLSKTKILETPSVRLWGTSETVHRRHQDALVFVRQGPARRSPSNPGGKDESDVG